MRHDSGKSECTQRETINEKEPERLRPHMMLDPSQKAARTHDKCPCSFSRASAFWPRAHPNNPRCSSAAATTSPNLLCIRWSTQQSTRQPSKHGYLREHNTISAPLRPVRAHNKTLSSSANVALPRRGNPEPKCQCPLVAQKSACISCHVIRPSASRG